MRVYNGIPETLVPELLKLKEPKIVQRKNLGGGIFDIWKAIPMKGGVTVEQWIEAPRVTTNGSPIRFPY